MLGAIEKAGYRHGESYCEQPFDIAKRIFDSGTAMAGKDGKYGKLKPVNVAVLNYSEFTGVGVADNFFGQR